MAGTQFDSFSSRVSLNMVTNIVRTVIMALVGFLMVPYYIGEFGLSTYAIIPLVTTITTYFLAMSDSLANAFTRYMAVAVQQGDVDTANRTYTSSTIGMLKCIAALMPVVLLVSVLAPYIFDVGEAHSLDVQLAFFMILVSSLMLSFSACMGSVFMAHNKMYITYTGRIIHCVLQVGLVLAFFLFTEPSLTLIGVSYVVSTAVFLIIMAVYLRRECPQIRFSRSCYDPHLLRKMSGLGLWAIICEFGSLMFIQASMIVVNLMVGSTAQGSFSVAANVISMTNTACTSIAAAAMPLAYRCYAQRDTDGMVRILKIFTKFVGLFMAFPLAYVMIFAPQVIGIWLGSGYSDIYPMLYIMLPAEVAVCTVNALIEVPVVFERMRPVALATGAFGVLNVLMSVVILTVTDWGVLGVCVSWTVSMLLLKLVFYPLYASKLTSGGLKKYIPSLAYSYVAFAVLLAIGYASTRVFTLPTTWTAVLLSLLVGFLIYFVVMMRLLFNKEERELVTTFLPGFVQRIIHS